MGLKHCMYVAWTPDAVRHWPVEYNHEYFEQHMVPECTRFMRYFDCYDIPNQSQGEKDVARDIVYNYFPECDPKNIVRSTGLSEEHQINLMHIDYLP